MVRATGCYMAIAVQPLGMHTCYVLLYCPNSNLLDREGNIMLIHSLFVIAVVHQKSWHQLC